MNKDSEGYKEFLKCNEFNPNSDYQEVWNAAIEAAAKLMDEMGEEERITIYIRELKK